MAAQTSSFAETTTGKSSQWAKQKSYEKSAARSPNHHSTRLAVFSLLNQHLRRDTPLRRRYRNHFPLRAGSKDATTRIKLCPKHLHLALQLFHFILHIEYAYRKSTRLNY